LNPVKNLMEERQPFSSDRPIRSRAEDKLGRRPFAEAIAAAIQGWRGDDSLVIGLYGPWGCGKSSIKNMIVDALGESPESNRLDIVECNPWQFAGHDQLSEAFFLEVGTALGRTDKSREGKRLAAKWRAYASALTLGSSLIGGLRGTLAVILLVAGIVGLAVSLVSQKVSWLLWAAVLVIGALLKWSATFAQRLSQWFSAREESNRKSLPELKQELSNLLCERNRPLLVVMDDVDRLAASEIQLLFQLVKVNADLPRLVYLLLFQREIVEKSLEALAPTSGREFLEKIVQAGFDVPVIERSRVERILFQGLDEFLGVEEVANRFKGQRWGNLFIPGLRPYFESLRDVHRFLSTLSFQIGLFRSGDSFEVNPVDLIALEVLRVFEPDVYNQLPGAKRILTEQHGSRSLSGISEDEVRAVVEGIIARAPVNRQPMVREILKQLFPHIEWVFGGSHYGDSFEEGSFRDLRICSKDVFDRYFQFAVPEGDLSQAELDRILSLVRDRNALASELRALGERGLLATALDRLEAYKERVPLEHAEAFITALFDIGDEFPDRTGGFFDIGPDMHASRIIYWYLRREQDQQRREQVLENAVQKTRGLYLPVMKVSLESDKEARQKDPKTTLVGEERIEILKKICVDKIREAAANGRLAGHPKLAYLLYRWRDWAVPDEPRAWVADQIKSRDELLSMLKGFTQRSTSTGVGDYVSRVRWYIPLKSLEDFVKAEDVEEELTNLSLDGLGEEEERAVHEFKKAMKRRRAGKSDDWHPSRDDDNHDEGSP